MYHDISWYSLYTVCSLWVTGVECHFQQYFSYILAFSFISNGNQSKVIGENHRVNDQLYYIMLYQVHKTTGIKLSTLMVLDEHMKT